MTTPSSSGPARRAKIMPAGSINKQTSNGAPRSASGTGPNTTPHATSGGFSGGPFTTFTTNTTTTDAAGVIEIVNEVLGRIAPERSDAFKALTKLLMDQYAVGARGAMQLAAEYAGYEKIETCEAIRTLAGDGWTGTLTELIEAARAL